MTIALLTHTIAQSGNTNSVTTPPIDTTGATLVVFAVSDYDQSAASSVSDSKGNSAPTMLTAQTVPSNGRIRIGFYANPINGTGHTFTASGTGTYVTLAVACFSGVRLSSPFDQQGNSQTGAGTSLNSATITPSEPGELVVGALGGIWTGTASASGGTITDQAPLVGGVAFADLLVYAVQTTATAATFGFSWSGSAGAMTSIASFKAAGSGIDTVESPDTAAITASATTGASIAAVESTDRAMILSPNVYYVDNAGSDANNGRTPATAWQTCSKVNSTTLVPGDVVIFTAGQTFTGPLTIANSGNASGTIRIGTGRNSGAAVPDFRAGDNWSSASNPAVISAGNTYGSGVNLNDCEYIWLDNLKIVGTGVNIAANTPLAGHGVGYTASQTQGLSLKCTQTGQALRGVRISAVESTGVEFGATAWMPSITHKGWDGLQVYKCSFHDCQWWAWQGPVVIDMDTLSGYNNNPTYPSANCYWGYSEAYNIPGDQVSQNAIGFAFFTTDNNLIEYCVAHDIQLGGGLSGTAGTAGIQFAGPTNSVVRYCEAYKVFANRSHTDGHGFEMEPGNSNNRWEYCYAHDNDAAGFMVGGGTIRYCVSVNNLRDAAAVTAVGAVDGEILHNTNNNDPLTVYGCTVFSTVAGIHAYSNGGFGATGGTGGPGSEALYNNILVAPSGTDVVRADTLTGLIGNVYYANGGTVHVKNHATSGDYTTLAALRSAGFETYASVNYGYFGDPQLANPTGAPATGTLPSNRVATLAYWNPAQPTSPGINAGIDYSALSITPGSKDFHEGTNFLGGAYDAGAVETVIATVAAVENSDVANIQALTAIGSIATSETSDTCAIQAQNLTVGGVSAVESSDICDIQAQGTVGTTSAGISAVESSDRAFLIGDSGTPPVIDTGPTGGEGGLGHRRTRRRVQVEIDGEIFEVNSLQDAYDLLLQARETAKEAAKKAADKAVAKAAVKDSPAGQIRALKVPIPEVKLVYPGEEDSLAREMQAAVAAARADIERSYREAMQLAEKRLKDAEDELHTVITLLLM